MKKTIHVLGLGAAMLSLAVFTAAEASAQRGGRGGGGRGGGGGHQVRSSAGGSMHSASRSTSNVNRSASRSNTNVNRSGNRVNTGNINTGDVNIDVDRSCCGGGWGNNYHPVARGVTVAATTAVVMGAYYNALPGGCAPISRAAVTYYQCGASWYQPVYSGADVQYVVVQAP